MNAEPTIQERINREIASRKQRDLLEPRRLGKAEHQVHVLHRLTGRALHQIVERRDR